MKKNLLNLLMMLALMAGGNALMGQWAQYHANELPDEDATMNIKNDKTVLVSGTNSIVVDETDATNNLWKIDNNTAAGDNVSYKWYPSYYDPDGVDQTYVPAPTTIACKFKWIDATYDFGPDLEIREVHKAQAKVVVDSVGTFKVKVVGEVDTVYNLPGTFDPTVWHVFRFTINNGTWTVYIDENATPVASGMGGKLVNKHLCVFGAWAETGTAGLLIDWMGWLESEASSPTDMPLPAGIFEPPVVSVNPVSESLKLSLYPNPASEMLTVSIGNDLVNSRYELTNITGKVMQKGLLNAQTNRVDVSSFNSGMYFIRVVSGEKVMSDSFIVK